eukprot:359988-Chlamydomonas_euryale.AAC.1
MPPECCRSDQKGGRRWQQGRAAEIRTRVEDLGFGRFEVYGYAHLLEKCASSPLRGELAAMS